MLLKLLDDVVGNAKPLFLVQFVPQAANHLAGALSAKATANRSMSPRVRMGDCMGEQKRNRAI